MHGFTFNTVFKQEWIGPDIFSVKSYDGYDGADSVSEYEGFFEYTDDGKLDYFRLQGISSIENFYDEKERLLYEDCYITHGSYEYYYIYNDDGKKQAYCLGVDNNLGYYMPMMMRF